MRRSGFIRSSNPVLSHLEKSDALSGVEAASYQGITLKTGILLALAALTGFFAVTQLEPQVLVGVLIPSLIIALIAVMVASFVPRLAMPFSIIYALAEGIVLGVITLLVNSYVPGAAITALIATATIFTVMLFLYSSRTIRVTSYFRRVMTGALISMLIFFILFGILGLTSRIMIANTGIAIGISVFLIIFGALLLALDFDRAERIVTQGADKRYEWVVALGLMVTIVWIYIEVLRLILIISARNRN